MSTAVSEPAKKSSGKTNRVGLSIGDYKGLKSTLCKGCGHDAITSSIVKAFYEMGIEPHRVAKLSGIGCSSKSANYFLSQSHGFNSVHGRMAAIATGAAIANRTLINIGVSGDGDTASIGLGHFMHMLRRNPNLIYLIENNGVYGLTKGQFSATADKGSVRKGGDLNEMPAIDCCALAIQMGCGFVARSFSGDTKQVQSLLKAAISYEGVSVIDILSPCVTFNNHEGSTKSVAFARSHEEQLHDIDFVPHFEDIAVDYDPGETRVVEMHDGSEIRLRKVDRDYDASDKRKAVSLLEEARDEGHFYTGLIYCRPETTPCDEHLNLVEGPLATLGEAQVRPSNEAFQEIMDSFR